MGRRSTPVLEVRRLPDSVAVLIASPRYGEFWVQLDHDVWDFLQEHKLNIGYIPGRDKGYFYVSFHKYKTRAYVLLHRLAVGTPLYGLVVDHINGNPTDNRKQNLQIVTQSINAHRQRRTKPRAAHFKGAYLFRGRWVSQIWTNGKTRYLGSYSTELEAAQTYDKAAREYWGNQALLNFPDEVSHG